MILLKRIFIILVFAINFPSILLSNEVTKARIFINTINSCEIQMHLYLKEDIDYIKATKRQTKNSIFFKVKELETGNVIYDSTLVKGIRFGDKKILFTIFPGDTVLTGKIFSKGLPIYIDVDSDIVIDMPKEEPVYTLKKEIIKEFSSKYFTLSERQKELLLSASGGTQIELRNNFDFSKRISNSDTTKSEFVFNFDFINRISFSPFNVPLFIKLTGSISDNVKNPLNRTEMFLIGNLTGIKSMNFELGRIGNQDFSRNALQFSLSSEGLIDNFIDLTNGHTRLRLKPYIKGGLSCIKNYQIDNPFGNTKFNLKLFTEGYYYVPVSEKFALIFKGEASYSDSYKDDEKFRFLYNLTLGYDLPLEDLKALIKIQSGQNDIYIHDDTRLLVGLMFNFIEF